MRSISNNVYLLPLLFSTFAKLGQLYSSMVILSALLLWGVQSQLCEGVFVVKIHDIYIKVVCLFKSYCVFLLKTLNSMDVMAH